MKIKLEKNMNNSKKISKNNLKAMNTSQNPTYKKRSFELTIKKFIPIEKNSEIKFNY